MSRFCRVATKQYFVYNSLTMSNHVPSTQVDISTMTMPELIRLAEEVATTQTPRELVRHKKPLAVLMPVAPATTATAAYKASLASLGSWSDLDADELIAHVSRAREAGSRPATRP